MNSRAKALLYHNLGQLLRAGVTLPRAVEKLVPHAHGDSRQALLRMAARLSDGATASEALAAPRELGALDTAVLVASDKAGRLEKGLAQAEHYHEAMAEVRSSLLAKTAYPLFILHLAGLAFALPLIFGPDGSARFGWALGSYLLGLWGVLLGIYFLYRLVVQAAAVNVGLDRLLAAIPVAGKLRRSFALGRFCLAYDMQLEAGINVMSALETAARASGSATFVKGAQEALPGLRNGDSLSAALAHTGAFPADLVRAISIGEDTGQLEVELQREAKEHRETAQRKLRLIVEWLPRLALVLVAFYIGWRMLEYYRGVFQMSREIGL